MELKLKNIENKCKRKNSFKCKTQFKYVKKIEIIFFTVVMKVKRISCVGAALD